MQIEDLNNYIDDNKTIVDYIVCTKDGLAYLKKSEYYNEELNTYKNKRIQILEDKLLHGCNILIVKDLSKISVRYKGLQVEGAIIPDIRTSNIKLKVTE